MSLSRLARQAVCAGVLLALACPAPAGAAGPSLVLLEPELEGDLGDTARLEDWHRRLALIADHLEKSLGESGLYRLVDSAPARDLILSYRGRTAVHACEPCIVTLAKRLDADRALSVWVYRMSNLVLSLHAVLRDGESGAILYARTLSFRGDNDGAWTRAVDYLVRDIAAIPADQR